MSRERPSCTWMWNQPLKGQIRCPDRYSPHHAFARVAHVPRPSFWPLTAQMNLIWVSAVAGDPPPTTSLKCAHLDLNHCKQTTVWFNPGILVCLLSDVMVMSFFTSVIISLGRNYRSNTKVGELKCFRLFIIICYGFLCSISWVQKGIFEMIHVVIICV